MRPDESRGSAWPSATGRTVPSESFIYGATYLGLPIGTGVYTLEHSPAGETLVRATVSTHGLANLFLPVHATQESLLVRLKAASASQRVSLVPTRFIWSENTVHDRDLPVVTIDRDAGLATCRRVLDDGIRVEFLAVDHPLDLLSLIENIRQGALPGTPGGTHELLTPRGKLFVRVQDAGRESIRIGDRCYRGCRHVVIDSLQRESGDAGTGSRALFRYSLWVAPGPPPIVVRAARHGLLGDTLVDLVSTVGRAPLADLPRRHPYALGGLPGHTATASGGRGSR